MRPKWLKLASLAQKTCTLYIFGSLVYSLLPKSNLFKNIFKNNDSRVISIFQDICCDLHTIGNHCAECEHPVLKNERGIHLQAINKFSFYMTLTFDSKVISVTCNLRCNQHAISSHCAKYEHPQKIFELQAS